MKLVAGLLTTIAALAPAVAQSADPFDDPAFREALPPLDAVPLPPAPAVLAPVEPPVDPALTAPLPPLATFDTTPPAETAVVADDDAPPIRYQLAVKGLEEVELDDRFEDLSALLRDGSKAANAAQVSARAEEDVRLIERILRSEGYYDGVATATVDTVAGQPGNVQVSIVATPGKRYALGAINVTGAAPEPERLARAALDLKTGNPIVAAEIEASEAQVSLRLPEQGYPFVELGQRDVLLDSATFTGDYTLPVNAGPKARYGGLRTEGDPVFTIKHIDVLTRFDRGDLYDSRLTDDLRQALIATGLYSTVAVEPVRTGQVLPDGTEAVDLLVRQTRGPARTLAGSAGYGTGEGIKLTGSWTHRNLFPPEGALSVAAVAGTQEESLNVGFRRSNAGQRDRAVQANASIARQDFAAFNAQTINLSGSISRVSTPIWQKRWTYSVGAELVATRETRFDQAEVDRERNTFFIAALPLQLGYDLSDSLLDPTKGFRVTGRLSPEAQKRAGGGFDGYARMLLEGSGYFPVMDSLILAARARVGSIMGAARDDIAPSRRLYAGGGGSVRGFGFQELGPRDANGDPIGGRSLTEFAIEARYRFGNFGIVPFVDAGRVGESASPSLSGMRYGVGIGGRYYTNFGPLRVDIATPLGRREGEAKVALYISIGQAF